MKPRWFKILNPSAMPRDFIIKSPWLHRLFPDKTLEACSYPYNIIEIYNFIETECY